MSSEPSFSHYSPPVQSTLSSTAHCSLGCLWTQQENNYTANHNISMYIRLVAAAVLSLHVAFELGWQPAYTSNVTILGFSYDGSVRTTMSV